MPLLTNTQYSGQIPAQKGVKNRSFLGVPPKSVILGGTPKITVFGPLFEHLLTLPNHYQYIQAFSVPLLTNTQYSGQIPAQKGVKNRSF